ncbi:exonuclease domain-containing protein [Flavobacterium sp. I-SCBP12n]|uniref:Exonuclease domain-containing protein n=1 Tax=Flavobacterium pygoscelis TaxID=2893176 RepID=A0A9X1XWP0_9FLAO|nr:exonuclease domain-containing protein [Flavobacterium pygoscelis]MCK8143146.1 exonuclease domain-containing protein [Flavobacterium pygoscelis]
MKKQEYAIVDIETTGGNASHSRITEIAILIHDGEKVIERWETLINPEKEIPPAIFALTGITNEMVSDAPIFEMISDTVFEMLSNRIFVAHNVNFDYSFIRHELEKAGIKWTAKKLCTVRAARKIKPGLPSYSLGRLCKSLEIDLENRHRAGGDADATAILFSNLLAWDSEHEIDKMIQKTSQDQRLPPNLPREDFDQLPEKIGVYYFYNEQKKVVYVGKAINLKKRVASHFSGHKITPQRQNFLRDIYAITFEVCGTELIALILECTEIKDLWPIHNKALKRFEPKYGLLEYEARNGYRYLAISKLAKNQNCIETFDAIYPGINLLRELAEKFEIDQRFCKYGSMSDGVFSLQNDTAILPEIESHNEQIQIALDSYLNSRPSFAIIDKGRNKEELSCIWIEKGHFYGMGYLPSDNPISDLSYVKDHITRYPSNQYIMQIINAFALKYPSKILFFQADSE